MYLPEHIIPVKERRPPVWCVLVGMCVGYGVTGRRYDLPPSWQNIRGGLERRLRARGGTLYKSRPSMKQDVSVGDSGYMCLVQGLLRGLSAGGAGAGFRRRRQCPGRNRDLLLFS